MSSETSLIERLRKPSVPTRISIARGGAEFASIAATGLGSMLIADVLFDKEYKSFKRGFAKRYIQPHLDHYEKILGYLPSIDPPQEKEERHKQTEEEQAVDIANKLVDLFGLNISMSIAGQFAGQYAFNRLFKVPNITGKELAVSVAADRGVQFGGIIALNRVIPKQAIAWQSGLQNVLQNAGMDEQSAERWASYAVNWQVPNLAGAAASIGVLYHFARR